MNIQCDIIWHDSLDSTNKEARRYIDSCQPYDKLTVIAASEQTCGRGQGDHKWHSSAGQNLTFSLLVPMLQFGLEARREQLINSLVTPVIRTFLKCYGVESWVKPPNDIWVDERKICGILVENILCSDKVEWSIIGIGLNLNQTVWPAELPNPVSLCEITGNEYDSKKILEEISRDFLNRLAGTDFKNISGVSE